VEGQVK